MGVLSQGYVYPRSSKLLPRPNNIEELFSTVRERFVTRSRVPPNHADSMWKEALGQVVRGRLGPPRKLNREGRFSDSPNEEINLVFRFPVFQSDKVRAIDDLKQGLVNEFCVIDSPIVLPSWGHVVEQILPTNGIHRGWDFLKIDHESAYKNLPIRPSDSRFCNIVLWSEVEGCWFAFEPKTQIFGSIASVLHYNVFSRLLASLINRILGILILGYVDDFGSPIPASLGIRALKCLNDFCEILGWF